MTDEIPTQRMYGHVAATADAKSSASKFDPDDYSILRKVINFFLGLVPFSWKFKGTVAKSVDMRADFPPVYDQGTLGSCVWNAIAGNMQYFQKKNGEPMSMPSRLAGYYYTRLSEGDLDVDGGCSIDDGLRVAVGGICPESLWPYDITKYQLQPTTSDHSLYATEWRNVDETSENDIKMALTLGFPVLAGISVYESFESKETLATGMVPMPDIATEKLLGSHCILLVGYTTIAGVDYYILRNSWSASIGIEGYEYLPTTFMSDGLCSDTWVMIK